MRFIGNKEKLVENIYNVVLDTGLQSGIFCDFFSGTSNVGRYFKQKGFSIISSDGTEE
jgi:adenine-specific DNA-methyltransferase